jgi:hypothetical protein
MNPLPIILAVQRFFPVNDLRNALAAHHLHATVSPLDSTGIKIKVEKGTDRAAVANFVNGFLAGFQA